MAAEGQPDRLASDMEACMKVHVEKLAPTDIHQCLLTIYGDRTVDVSTVRQWVVLLFITGKNAEIMVVTALKISVL